MRYAILRCCITNNFIKFYEPLTNEIFKALDIDFIDIKDFNCCGYPLQNINQKAYLLMSARNIALARRHNVHIFTCCSCCYGSLKKAKYILERDNRLKKEIDEILAKENLKADLFVVLIRHILEVLYSDVGIEGLLKRIKKKFNGLKVAVHYGCHILRPKGIVSFEPSKFEELIKIIGLNPVSWSMQSECCGSPIMGIDSNLGLNLAKKKIKNAKEAGAELLCCICPYCYFQFRKAYKVMAEENGDLLPIALYSQLLGMCLNIDKSKLALDRIPLGTWYRHIYHL